MPINAWFPSTAAASNRYRFEFWNDPDYGGIIVKKGHAAPKGQRQGLDQ